MASNICSFNLQEVCEATIEYLKNTESDLAKFLKAPDLASGGQLIYNEQDIREMKPAGVVFKLRAKYRFDQANNCLEIYQIPFTTTSEAIIDAVIELVKSGKIKEIVDIRDETDLNGLKITIDLRKNVEPDSLMNKLFKLTPLQDSLAVILIS